MCLGAAVSEILADFSNFHIWAWNPKCEERSQSCICTLFLAQGSKLSLFSLYGHPFSRYGPIFKISIFGHEICNLKKGPKVAYVLSFYPRGSKSNLFSLYGQLFSRRGLIFKIPMFGHAICDLKKAPIVAYVLFFHPRGSKMSLFLLYGQWLSRYGSFSP